MTLNPTSRNRLGVFDARSNHTDLVSVIIKEQAGSDSDTWNFWEVANLIRPEWELLTMNATEPTKRYGVDVSLSTLASHSLPSMCFWTSCNG